MFQPKISHLGPRAKGEGGGAVAGTPSLPYLCYSRRVTVPAYTVMEHRDGPKKPQRKKLYPSTQKFEIFVTDRIAKVWKCDITAAEHNIDRKRPGGRDESWLPEDFMDKFQQAFQFPTENELYMFLFKENPDSGALTLTIKERSGKVMIIYNNPALLERYEGGRVEEVEIEEGGRKERATAEEIIAAALAEENSLFRTYCIKGHLDLIKLFVKNGVSIDALYAECWSPLQLSIQYGHEEVSKWLILKGCDLLRVSSDGRYALGMVVAAGNLELLQLMVKRGLELDEETYENMNIETPMMLATLHGHKHIVEWMCGPKGYRTVREAKKFGKRNTTKGSGMFETVEGYYPQVWGVTAGVDDGIKEGMYA